jgi:hypothetical protein
MRVVINKDLLLKTTRSCGDKTYLNDTDTYSLKVKRKWGGGIVLGGSESPFLESSCR